jgi:membrane protease YdiL (CAAX protease family)
VKYEASDVTDPSTAAESPETDPAPEVLDFAAPRMFSAADVVPRVQEVAVPTVPPVPRFCNACGNPWQPEWATCAACESRGARRGGDGGSGAEVAGRENPIRPGLWLYFLFLATSVVGMIAIACDAPAVPTELWASGFISAAVLIWSGFTWREVLPPLRRVPHVGWFALAVAASVGTFAIASAALFILARLTGLPESHYTPEFSAAGFGPLFVILIIAVQPGIFEELAFRGVIFGGLRHVLSPVEAVIVSAAMFMIIHLSVPSFPHLFVIGLALGWLRVRTGSLYPGMLLHFCHNLLCVGWEYWRPGLPW